MNDILNKYYDVIKRTVGSLYQMNNGQNITHSDLRCQAEMILPVTLRNPNAKQMSEYSAIVKCVMDLYEAEVGVKTYTPNVLSKDKQSKYWLYRAKPNTPRPYFERYKLYLSKDGFSQKAIENIEIGRAHV